MGKIKLNLISGAIVEKPLINAFKANNNEYIVLDNEMNGSMGLPIILVCKFVDNKLTKITDQNEWAIVKEYLKNIIAGNQIEFIKVSSELIADDIYYTQLTLPVPSFDALKNAYKVEDDNVEANVEMNNVNPISDLQQEAVSVAPVMPDPVNMGAVNPESTFGPAIDLSVAPQVEVQNVETNIAPAIEVVNPVSPQDIMPPVNQEIAIEPQVTNVEDPISSPSVSNNEVSVFQEQKEAFMQACENMFDALVQKFERELENRK